jgi:hypothetical protein
VTLLTAILTHLPAPVVRRQSEYLRALAPEVRFVVCHGGSAGDFAALEGEAALFVEDPSLRGPHFKKSLNRTLRDLFDRFVAADSQIDLVYVIEYDHLILRGDFETSLRALAVASPTAGLLAKNASPRNDTNWSHYLAVRGDPALDRYIAALSGRDDPTLRFGCLGTGMLLRREALAAFRALDDSPPYYVELFVPTVIYHLGFDVVDIDAQSDLYRAVRWLPPYELGEARALQQAGATFVHPFKRLDQLDALAATAATCGSGVNSSVAAPSP